LNDTAVPRGAMQTSAAVPDLRWGSFVDASLERAFREDTRREDVHTISVGMAILAIYAFTFAPSDYLLFGWSPTFFGLLALRVGMSALCVFFLLALRRDGAWAEWRDTMVLGWSFYMIFMVACVNLTRSPDYVLSVAIDICGISIYYLLFINRFLWQVVPAVLYAVVACVVFLLSKEGLGLVEWIAAVVAYGAVTVSGVLTAWWNHRRRRTQWFLEQRLQKALSEIKTLQGLVPICASCHKVRDDAGIWTALEQYVRAHSTAEFSHGLCPECLQRQMDEAGIPWPQPSRDA